MGSSSSQCKDCKFFRQFFTPGHQISDVEIQFGLCLWYFQSSVEEEIGYKKGQKIREYKKISPENIRLFETINKNKELKKLKNVLFEIKDWSNPDIQKLGNILTETLHIPVTYKFFSCKWYE